MDSIADTLSDTLSAASSTDTGLIAGFPGPVWAFWLALVVVVAGAAAYTFQRHRKDV